MGLLCYIATRDNNPAGIEPAVIAVQFFVSLERRRILDSGFAI